MKQHSAEGADNLYKAFEHEKMEKTYWYSKQEAVAFLGQLEAHPLEKERITQ